MSGLRFARISLQGTDRDAKTEGKGLEHAGRAVDGWRAAGLFHLPQQAMPLPLQAGGGAEDEFVETGAQGQRQPDQLGDADARHPALQLREPSRIDPGAAGELALLPTPRPAKLRQSGTKGPREVLQRVTCFLYFLQACRAT